MYDETHESVTRRKVLQATGAATAALTIGTTTVSADEILGVCEVIVNPQKDRGDYSSIDTAVTEVGKIVKSTDCDHGVVKVHKDIYEEQVVFDQPNVHLQPINDKAPTIRYESDSGQPAVKVDRDGIVMSGFNVERASAGGRDDTSPFAQGIRISASDVWVSHNVVSGEFSDVQNKGVMILDDGKDLANIAINSNDVSGFEGGISTTLAYEGSISGVSVKGNAVSDNGDGINVATLNDGASPSDVEIVGNDVFTNAVGIHVYGADDSLGLAAADASEVTATGNNVAGNAVGARNDGAGTLDATDCWWGHQTGPERNIAGPVTFGEGDRIEGDVAFRPWALSNN